MDQEYDYKSLIEAYIAAKRKGFLHEDFKVFYTTRLAKLEEAFGLRFDDANKALWMFFDATVRSYYGVYHPSEGFLDDSLINVTLMKQGELGEAAFESSRRVLDIVEQHRQVVLEMLSDIFVCMFGKVDKVITSADLRELGFDDSTEPRREDYYKFM
jgi:hypothetical protein